MTSGSYRPGAVRHQLTEAAAQRSAPYWNLPDRLRV